ncbi:MAG: sigma-70 family RNA polymerase sigma factor [Adhaeribacter sp.]
MEAFLKTKTISDPELITKILAGETAIYEILIRRSNPYLFKVGRAYGFNKEDVEDLMQDTFISAYKNLAKFEHRASFKTWLVKIMLHHCYHKKQLLRFKNERPAYATITEKEIPMFSHQTSDPDKKILHKELGLIIEQAIDRIPVDYRLVFSLRELNGMSVAETAEAMALSETNVKVRLNRAKAMLRKEIEKMYAPEDIYEFNLIYCDRMVDRVMHQINNPD